MMLKLPRKDRLSSSLLFTVYLEMKIQAVLDIWRPSTWQHSNLAATDDQRQRATQLAYAYFQDTVAASAAALTGDHEAHLPDMSQTKKAAMDTIYDDLIGYITKRHSWHSVPLDTRDSQLIRRDCNSYMIAHTWSRTVHEPLMQWITEIEQREALDAPTFIDAIDSEQNGGAHAIERVPESVAEANAAAAAIASEQAAAEAAEDAKIAAVPSSSSATAVYTRQSSVSVI